MSFRLIYFFLILTICVRCSHAPINPIDPGLPVTNACHPDTVYFQNEILPLFSANCASSGCHGENNPADGLSLTTYSGIMEEVKPGEPNKSEVYKVLYETGSDLMPPPPAAPIDSTSAWKIYTWITQGALNNSCTDCDTTSGSYSLTIAPVIQAQCKSCHSANSLSGGIALTSHSDIVSAVSNSGLLPAIKRMSNSPMPPAAPLSTCDLAQFEKWIADGMPNN